MRYAVIDEKTDKCINVILWDGRSNWKPPEGHYIVRHDECQIDDHYDTVNRCFVSPMHKMGRLFTPEEELAGIEYESKMLVESK